MKRNNNLSEIIKGIELGIFKASICFEGTVPVKDINLIQTFLNKKKLNIKELLDRKEPVVLW